MIKPIRTRLEYEALRHENADIRRQGKTTAAMLQLLGCCIEDPGTWYTYIDHFLRGQPVMEVATLKDMVHALGLREIEFKIEGRRVQVRSNYYGYVMES